MSFGFFPLFFAFYNKWGQALPKEGPAAATIILPLPFGVKEKSPFGKFLTMKNGERGEIAANFHPVARNSRFV
jgi:hypothetical protein